jgi:hypothetical protein
MAWSELNQKMTFTFSFVSWDSDVMHFLDNRLIDHDELRY